MLTDAVLPRPVPFSSRDLEMEDQDAAAVTFVCTSEIARVGAVLLLVTIYILLI